MALAARGIGVLLVFLVVAGLAACASMEPAAPKEPSLYKRLGGREGIALVVDDFVNNMTADSRVNARFKALDAPKTFKLKSDLSDQVCDATGGPCSYHGRDMKTTHAGMKITDDEWNATVENLVKAMDKRKVGKKEQDELIAVLGSMRQDIVGQ